MIMHYTYLIILNISFLRDAFNNKKKKCNKCYIGGSFKPYIFEVELPDGRESSENFFKSGMAVRCHEMSFLLFYLSYFMDVRYAGSKLCVDSFEIGKLDMVFNNVKPKKPRTGILSMVRFSS